METWREVHGSNGHYHVSSFGNVRSHKSRFPRQITPRDLDGYSEVGLWIDGRKQRRFVHRLVLEAFVGPRPDGMECCHGDGNRKNNRLENLRWDTSKANKADKKLHGSKNGPIGSEHGSSKLDERGANQELDMLSKGFGVCYIAKHLGVSHSRISEIKSGKTWRHVSRPTQESGQGVEL